MSERRAGAVLSLVAGAVAALVALATTPVIVRGLGAEGYGAYAMALSLLAVFMLFDGGLSDAAVRFAVRYRRKGRMALGGFLGRLLPLYGMGAGLLCGAGALSIAADAAFSPEPLPQLYVLAFAGALASLLANPFKVAMIACERFVAARLMEIAVALATAVATVNAVALGGGPAAVLGAVVGGLVLLAAARATYVVVRLGLPVRLRPMRGAMRRRIGRHARPVLVAAAVEALFWRIDTLLIGWVLGPAAVAPYAVALLFQKHVLRLSVAVARVMVPATVRAVDGGAAPDALADHLARVGRVQALLLGTATIALVAFGDRFIALWLGPSFASAYGLALLVVVPFALGEVGSLRNVVLQARGLYAVKARQGMAVAGLNLAATLALLPLVGVAGAAGATAAGLLVALLLANRLCGRRGGVDIVRFYRRMFSAVAPFLAALSLAAVAVRQLPLGGWAGLAAMGALYTGAVLAAGWTLAARDAERDAVGAAATRLTRALMRPALKLRRR